MTGRPRWWTGVVAALPGMAAAAALAAADLDLRQLCDPYTPLTLVGIDTEASVALFAMPSREAGVAAWTVELRASVPEARLYPDWRKRRRFGGSIAPGPVLTVTRCGESCLQLLAWVEGGWRELGAPLTASTAATVHATRDADGVPWLVLHRATDRSGVVVAEAFRLEAGVWAARGRMPVAGVGSPAVRPDPGERGAILSGSGRFRAGGEAGPWVAGLPDVGAAQRGQLVPLQGRRVAYLARDGSLYLSSDRGATWSRSSWSPAGVGKADALPDGAWSSDLPVSDHRAPLTVAWFDSRDAARPRLHLSEWQEGGDWRVVAELPAVELLDREETGYSHLLRFADRRWLLLAGCEVTSGGCALRLRTVVANGGSLGHSVRLQPAWLGTP